MKRYLTIGVVLGLGLLTAACGTTRADRGVSGASIGAGTGAAIGILGGPVGIGTGALVGGAIGAGVGAFTNSSQLDLGKPVWK